MAERTNHVPRPFSIILDQLRRLEVCLFLGKKDTRLLEEFCELNAQTRECARGAANTLLTAFISFTCTDATR